MKLFKIDSFVELYRNEDTEIAEDIFIEAMNNSGKKIERVPECFPIDGRGIELLSMPLVNGEMEKIEIFCSINNDTWITPNTI